MVGGWCALTRLIMHAQRWSAHTAGSRATAHCARRCDTTSCRWARGSARCERAQRVYAKALSRKPNSAALTIKIAQANLACGDTVAASRAARKALQISPGRLDATMVLGYSLLKDKKPREAERLLSPAVMLHPRSATLMCLLGRCHAAAGDSREARNCYRQAIILDPDSEVARKLFYRNEQEISANTAG